MSSQLCQNCYDVLSEYEEGKVMIIGREPVRLQPYGCIICATINMNFTKRSSPDVFRPRTLSKVLHVFDTISPNMCSFVTNGSTAGDTSFSRFAIMPLQNHTLPWTQHISADTLSPGAMSFLRSKLKECLDTHTDCHRYTEACSSGYPTRLLDLSSHDCSKVSLVDTTRETNGPYFTLSHCWGASQPLKLTRNSEQSLRDGVDMNTLPKTFRQAIEVCRQLGIGYLWIDSMCIFQDNLTDWHSQAALMRQVYASALCNIAATSATDSSHGLRFHRDVNAMQPFTVASPSRSTSKGQTYTYAFYPNHGNDDDVPVGALTRRAWVLQENILSRRILHFTNLGVYWECLTNLANDLYPNGIPTSRQDDGIQTKIAKLKKLLMQESKSTNKYDITTWAAEIYNGWSALCELYSDCELTFASDKLVALNGIAREVASKTGDSFVCGLWKQHLLPQLLWVTLWRSDSPINVNKEWRAPSWSWAMHDIGIRHPTHMPCKGGRDRASVEVIDIGELPSGQLQYASLTLHGRLVHATLTVDPAKLSEEFCQFSGPSKSTKHYLNHLFLDLPYRESIFHAQVVCIAVYEDVCEIELRPDEIVVAKLGILILKQCQSEPVKYKRIGVFLLDKKDCDLYAAHETQEEHSITII